LTKYYSKKEQYFWWYDMLFQQTCKLDKKTLQIRRTDTIRLKDPKFLPTIWRKWRTILMIARSPSGISPLGIIIVKIYSRILDTTHVLDIWLRDFFFKWTWQEWTITQFMFALSWPEINHWQNAGGCTCTDILYFGIAFLLSYLF